MLHHLLAAAYFRSTVYALVAKSQHHAGPHLRLMTNAENKCVQEEVFVALYFAVETRTGYHLYDAQELTEA